MANRTYSINSSYIDVRYPLPPKSISDAQFNFISPYAIDLTVYYPQTNFQDIWRIVVKDLDTGIPYLAEFWDFNFTETYRLIAPGLFSAPLFSTFTVLDITTYNVLGEPSKPFSLALDASLIPPVLPYIIQNFYSCKPPSGFMINRVGIDRTVKFAAGLPGSTARCKIAPTNNVSCLIQKNDATVGTVDYLAGSLTGTFTLNDDLFYNPGNNTPAPGTEDIYSLIAPSPQDPTFSGVGIVLVGTRST